jgi:hypothetical protein
MRGLLFLVALLVCAAGAYDWGCNAVTIPNTGGQISVSATGGTWQRYQFRALFDAPCVAFQLNATQVGSLVDCSLFTFNVCGGPQCVDSPSCGWSDLPPFTISKASPGAAGQTPPIPVKTGELAYFGVYTMASNLITVVGASRQVMCGGVLPSATPSSSVEPSHAPGPHQPGAGGSSRDGTIALMFFVGLFAGGIGAAIALTVYLKKKGRLVPGSSSQSLLGGAAGSSSPIATN